MSRRHADPFAPLGRLAEGLARSPLPPILFLSGDDEWFVREGVRRLAAAFQAAQPEGEVASYEGPAAVRDAVADTATVALFATNRLVILEATDLLRGKRLTAEEVDALLDEAHEAGDEARALQRLARRARSLAAAAGVSADADAAETARKVTGRVKRLGRAEELAALLELAPPEAEEGGNAEALSGYAAAASPGDNALLVHAVAPDPEHDATRTLVQRALRADLSVAGEPQRIERLAAVGFERALERGVVVETEVFEILTSRGRLSGRAFLTELDRLIAGAKGGRVRGEDAARLVADEKKEYGSDFVELVARRQFVPALHLLEKLLTSDDFTSFRPFGGKGEPAQRKGPRGDAAFFPLLGLLTGEIRRMLAVKVALSQHPGEARGTRRADYRAFADGVLPALKMPVSGAAPISLEGHPFVLYKAYAASFDWSLADLVAALRQMAAIDEGVKTGAGDGPDLLEAFLLSCVEPPGAASRPSR